MGLRYFQDDVLRLIRGVSYMGLRGPESGLRLLRRQAHAVEVWREFIPRYQSVRCEPLDFLYIYLQCLGAFDDFLLMDLLTEYTWRGIIWGAWLSALAPHAQHRGPLVKARPNAPHNQWVVDLALAAIDGERPEALAEHLDLLSPIRQALAPLPKPVIRLRTIEDIQVDNLEWARDMTRELYRTKGTQAAHDFLATGSWRFGLPSCPDWQSRVIDNGDGQRLGPNRDIWYWGYTL